MEFAVFYNLKFSLSGFPKIYRAIKINKDLHVQLEWCEDSVPLYTFIEEMKSRQHYKAKSRTPYSSQFLRFALLLRYSFAQAYQIVLEHLPFPSMTLL